MRPASWAAMPVRPRESSLPASSTGRGKKTRPRHVRRERFSGRRPRLGAKVSRQHRRCGCQMPVLRFAASYPGTYGQTAHPYQVRPMQNVLAALGRTALENQRPFDRGAIVVIDSILNIGCLVFVICAPIVFWLLTRDPRRSWRQRYQSRQLQRGGAGWGVWDTETSRFVLTGLTKWEAEQEADYRDCCKSSPTS